MKIFNPLTCQSEDSKQNNQLESTSSLVNDQMGICPKCKNPFGSGLVDKDTSVYYCEPCRVTQPLPV